MDVTQAIDVVRMTDIGLVRDHNEDNVASDLSIGLLILADGMGGYQAGELASEIAVLTITADLAESLNQPAPRPKGKLLPESQMLIEATARANAAIYHIAKEHRHCQGMGTTLVMGLFTNNQLVVGHIGDSRLYRLRADVLTQLTQDHSVLQAQINAGEITKEQAKNAAHKHLLTRALGTDPFVELELAEYDTMVGDLYLLCSDGLSDLVNDEEIQMILEEAGTQLARAASHLIRYANQLGGQDNISVVIARVVRAFPHKRRWLKTFLKNSQ